MSRIIRVIPVLLLKHMGIVKTVQFSEETYIGCPINAVRVFTAKNVDELILLDILATHEVREPSYDVIMQVADESCMPVTIGGGVRTIEHIRQLLRHGADKVVINTCALENPETIRIASGLFGSQCIVVSIDARLRKNGAYEVCARRGKTPTGIDPVRCAARMQELGAGEILLNSIDRDGSFQGYDLELVRKVSDAVTVPVIACGGAGKLQDLADAVDIGHASAVSAGSFFLFHGRRRGILINFPTRHELRGVLGNDRVRV